MVDSMQFKPSTVSEVELVDKMNLVSNERVALPLLPVDQSVDVEITR